MSSAWFVLAIVLALGVAVPRPVFSQAVARDAPAIPAAPPVVTAYGRLPLSFEANHGQAGQGVEFLARGHGYSILLASGGAALILQPTGQPLILRIRLIGAEPAPAAAGLDLQRGVVNYLLGDDPTLWTTGVPTYGRVAYQGVYPDIDLVYYGAGGDLEYDFMVGPGADPGVIRFELDGADRIELDDAGDLLVWTADREVRLRRPVLYQDVNGARHEVDGGYALVTAPLGDDRDSRPSDVGLPQLGFSIGTYDPTLPLVIDPVLVYSTYLGGSGTDVGNGIAVDRDGNAYLAGETQSSNFPTASPFQAARAGGQDVFIAKFYADGSDLAYATYLGGSGGDYANGIAVDRDGHAYVIGTTSSTNFPTVGPVQEAYGGGSSDAFIAKLEGDGSGLAYATYLGGSADDEGYAIAVDDDGNAYVTGYTASANFPTARPLQAARGGPNDAFVAKLNADGERMVYATYLGGSGGESGNGIAVDRDGRAHVTGETSSTNFPTARPLQAALGGGKDAFVAKLDDDGNRLDYATYLGGAADDQGRSIAVDRDGRAYVAGTTESTSFPTVRPLQATNGGGKDAFVAKLNDEGDRLAYSTHLGGSAADEGYGIAVDRGGNAYVVGKTASSNLPTQQPLQPTNGGGEDAFVAKLNDDGTDLAYGTYLGGSGADSGRGIAADDDGNAYVAGQTASTNFTVSSPYQPANGGGSDAFVARIADPGADEEDDDDDD